MRGHKRPLEEAAKRLDTADYESLGSVRNVPFGTLPSTPGKQFAPQAANCDTAPTVRRGDDKFLYASNRGHDSIACFSIDQSGELTGTGQVPTDKTPRSFDLEPSDRFLYAAGEESDMIALYQVASMTGAPKPPETYHVGRQP